MTCASPAWSKAGGQIQLRGSLIICRKYPCHVPVCRETRACPFPSPSPSSPPRLAEACESLFLSLPLQLLLHRPEPRPLLPPRERCTAAVRFRKINGRDFPVSVTLCSPIARLPAQALHENIYFRPPFAPAHFKAPASRKLNVASS